MLATYFHPPPPPVPLADALGALPLNELIEDDRVWATFFVLAAGAVPFDDSFVARDLFEVESDERSFSLGVFFNILVEVLPLSFNPVSEETAPVDADFLDCRTDPVPEPLDAVLSREPLCWLVMLRWLLLPSRRRLVFSERSVRPPLVFRRRVVVDSLTDGLGFRALLSPRVGVSVELMRRSLVVLRAVAGGSGSAAGLALFLGSLIRSVLTLDGMECLSLSDEESERCVASSSRS